MLIGKLYIFCTLCLIYLLTCQKLLGQSTFELLPDVDGLDNQSQAWSILTDSSEFFILGDLLDTVKNGNTVILPWLSIIDYDGNIQNLNTILDDPFEYPFRVARNSIFKNSINNLLIFGSQRVSGDKIKPRLIEVDPTTGIIINSKHFSNPIDSTLSFTRKLMVVSDSLIVLSGYFWINNHYNFHLIFLDHDFKILDNITISDNEFNNVVYYIALNSDSSITLIGDSRLASDISNFPEVTPFLMHVSRDGAILEYKRISGLKEKALVFPVSYTSTVSKDEFRNWIISCVSIVETNLCETCHYLVPYTLAVSEHFDSVLWITRFNSLAPKSNSQPTVTSLVKCSDNSGYITSGFDESSFIYKVDNNGDSIWLRKFIPLGWNDERASWTEFVDLKVTPFNTYLLTGRVSDNDLNVIRSWVIHIDSLGCLVPGCDSIVSSNEVNNKPQDNFLLYPNPTSNLLYILNRNSNSVNCNLSIFNVSGELLRQVNFDSDLGEQYILPLNSFSPGIYIITILDNSNKLLASRRILLQ